MLQEKVMDPVSTLSGGQRRAVSVSIALCGDSKVVFLDEPTSGIDANTKIYLFIRIYYFIYGLFLDDLLLSFDDWILISMCYACKSISLKTAYLLMRDLFLNLPMNFTTW